MTVSTNTFTIAFLAVFILCFFPPVFQTLIYSPLYLLTLPYYALQQASWSPFDLPAPPPVPPAAIVPVCLSTMSFFQKQFNLPSRSRGSYLITDHVRSALPEISQYKVGILHLFVQHTSCALSLNENWDEDVRADMSDALDRIAPEDHGTKRGLYRHSAEGSDDMPAHIKSALIGASVSVPITDGKLNTGTWQGIWYLEFRAAKHTRHVVATIQGEKM